MKLRELASRPDYALELGKAAEHLVVADLILAGYRCYLTDQGLPYDVIVDISGRLIRIQVKAACFAKNMNAGGRALRLGYNFSIRKRGKNGTGARLSAEHCDMVALVALDIKTIAYLPISEAGTTCQLMPPGFVFRGRFKRHRITGVDGLPFESALARCPLHIK